MSETHAAEAETAETDAPLDDAAFDAAREAEAADEPVEGEEGEAEAKPVDWQKRAIDKEGQAAKERARRRETERLNRELTGRIERLEADKAKPAAGGDTLESLIAAMPDPEDDPIGATAALTKIVKMFGDQQATETEAETRTQAAQREIGKLVTAMTTAESEFAEDHPDYDAAQAHFKATRRAEFEDMGYAGQALEKAMADDVIGLVRRCIDGGKDPAEVVYNLAKKRGFQSGKAQTDAKLKEIAAAAASGRTPRGGATGDNRLTPDAVNKLHGAAYDAAWAKLREQERRAG